MSLPKRFSADLAENIIECMHPINELHAKITTLEEQISRFKSRGIGYVDNCEFPDCHVWEVAGYRDSQVGLQGYCDVCSRTFCETHIAGANAGMVWCKLCVINPQK